MKKLDAFGIEVYLDEGSGELHFGEDVLCEKSSWKVAKEMQQLLYRPSDIDQNHPCYVFYMNIMRKQDQQQFEKYGYINGITVLMAGTMNGECHKNSGHYHCVSEGHTLPYPEVYEILCGEAMFLLQESHDFDQESMHVDSCKAVILKAGEKLVVPPYYAHCAVNIGEGVMAFGNLAAPCELDYEPIVKHHGFFSYVFKSHGKILLCKNDHYDELPKLTFMKAQESPQMGICFDKSIYEMFMKNPDCFAYLQSPEPYIASIDALLKEE